jgi:long-chain acyl-CoA synthetase
MASQTVQSTTTTPEHAAEPATLCAAFQATAAARPSATALRTADGATELTWAQYAARVRSTAEGLTALGVRRGDAIALMLTNRYEFNVVSVAAAHIGAVSVALYGSSPPDQVAYILRDAEVKVAITEPVLRPALEAAGVTLEHLVDVEDVESRRAPGLDFEAEWHATRPDELATLIYTSGTTGPPKGVEHTQASALATALAARAGISIGTGGRVISYLPNAHLADRCFSEWMPMTMGLETTFCPTPQEVVGLLPRVRPTIFMSVPRIWDRIRVAVEKTLPPDPDEHVRAAVRAKLGLDACEAPIVGSAPCTKRTQAFFHALGVPLVDAYAMTEIAPISFDPPGRARIGDVGHAVPGVEIRTAGDGEILVRGPALARGYRNRPDATREAFDAEGWFHTGDVGSLDDDGALRIVDRKKDLIINDAGKNMSPANIEAALKSAGPCIGQACVIGDRQPYNVALLTLDPEAGDPYDPDVRAAVAEEVERANASLAPHERIRRHRLLGHDWHPGEMLTPTLKLRRKAIDERYRPEIEAMYAEEG